MTTLPKAAIDGTAHKTAIDAAVSAIRDKRIGSMRLHEFANDLEIREIADQAVAAALPHLGEPNCWRVDETMDGGSIKWRTVEHQHHAMQIAAESVFPAKCYPLFRAPPAPAVKVRPLEWVTDATGRRHIAVTDVGSAYIVFNGRWRLEETTASGKCADDGAAKAAAQTDYERRIRSALVASAQASPAAEEGKE